jgi:hypothetical protein
MTDSMRERVARVLYDGDDEWVTLDPHVKNFYFNEAKCAIAEVFAILRERVELTDAFKAMLAAAEGGKDAE